MKHIANYISVSRIILSFLLLIIEPLSKEFLIIYIICGITDICDGYMARKTNTVSKLGDNLDSIGDFIMVIAVIFALYSATEINIIISIWVIVIGIIKILSIIIVFKKYKTFEMLHTYANKFTGVILFLVPIALHFIKLDIFMYVVCTSATIAAIEEVVINIISKELAINKKSVFC